MTTLRWAIAFWLAAGLTGFTVWTVRVFTTSDLTPAADRTTWLVWQCGRAFVWLAALASAGLVFGVAARAAWSLFGG